MSTVIFDHIVSCSSEDLNHPADNLIKSESYKKWKCKSPGENQASVVIQLQKLSQIVGVDIGNENSAFVEVLVGRSTGGDDFKVLLVSSSFMSPMEGRNGSNANRVRMFTKDQLSKPAVDEKWDRLKVVCTQPFNKHVQYGLCFINLHAPQNKDSPAAVSQLGRFVLKDDDEDAGLSVGGFFARRKEKPADEPVKGAAAIRDASSPAALLKQRAKGLDPASQSHLKRGTAPVRDTSSSSGTLKRDKKDDLLSPKLQTKNNKDEKKTPATKTSSSSASTNGSTSAAPTGKRPSDTQSTSSEKKKQQKLSDTKSVVRRPFDKLLNGVVLVISGYQNPLRGDLRSKAVDLGAKYKPDWDTSCTHLICAFPNTPKFNQVRGKGHIVTKDWIEDCHSKRCRLPWRRFALDKRDKGKAESEDEIQEEIVKPPSESSEPLGSDSEGEAAAVQESESDTDDEIERVRMMNGDYGGDTDVEKDVDRQDTSALSWPQLSDFFSGKTFFLHPELAADVQNKITRYIVAYKGKLSGSRDVQYIVVPHQTSEKIIKKVKTEHPGVVLVVPSWIWKCHNTNQLVPSTPFEL